MCVCLHCLVVLFLFNFVVRTLSMSVLKQTFEEIAPLGSFALVPISLPIMSFKSRSNTDGGASLVA